MPRGVKRARDTGVCFGRVMCIGCCDWVRVQGVCAECVCVVWVVQMATPLVTAWL
jgi:hypothetical protein